MSKKVKIIAGLGAAVVVVGALTAFIRGKDKDLPRVTTAKVDKMDLVAKVTANGKIQARNKVDMSALVMGQIVNLAVKEGDHVKKGQLLLQIDKVQLAAQAQGREATLSAMRHDLDAARANAIQAKSDYERAKQNFEAKILAEADYQKAKSSLDAAEATLAATEQRMNSTDVRSRRQPGLAVEDDGHRAAGGDRDVAPDQGGRGHGRRHDEQRRHPAHDGLGHVRSRGRHDGRRDLGAAGQARTEGDALDRRLPQQEVLRHRHGGGVLADPEDRSRPRHARRHVRGDQLQGQDPPRRIRPTRSGPAFRSRPRS